MKSDRVSEAGSSPSEDPGSHDGASGADRPALADTATDSGASDEMDRGTSLPERSRALDMGGGSSGGGSAGGGGKGKDQLGLSFEYAQERLSQMEQEESDTRARNAAAEQHEAELRHASKR